MEGAHSPRSTGTAESIEELDVQGILACAERVLPPAADLWVQASLDQKQRLQQLFLPEGIAFDGNRFNRTAVTAPSFKYLSPNEPETLQPEPGGSLIPRDGRNDLP